MTGKECEGKLQFFFQHIQLKLKILKHNIALPQRNLSKQNVAWKLKLYRELIKMQIYLKFMLIDVFDELFNFAQYQRRYIVLDLEHYDGFGLVAA